MKRFEFFEHTADVKFRAYGKTLSEAFGNAACALYTVVTDITKIEPKITKRVTIKSKRLRSLLYDFIDELVHLQDAEGFLLHKVKSITVNEDDLTVEAELSGDIFDNQYSIECQIKAATYSDMLIEEKEGVWMVQVVPDI